MDLEAYGTWTVTTEGDCEGRSTRDLGTHTGYLDDIAFALADKAYYGLQFKLVDLNQMKTKPKTGTKVQVSFDASTLSGALPNGERVQFFERILKGRSVRVSPGTYFGCVELVDGNSPEAQAAARKQVLKNAALAKLSADEREALGM